MFWYSHCISDATNKNEDAPDGTTDNEPDFSELHTMQSSSDAEETEDTTSSDSTDDGSDNDNYQERAVDVDSIVLPIFTQDFLLFTSVQMVSLLNYPVFVKDTRGAICIAEFGWRIFVLLSSILKVRLCKVIIAQGVVIISHPSQHAFIKRKCTISLQMLVRGLQKVNVPCHLGGIWYENELC